MLIYFEFIFMLVRFISKDFQDLYLLHYPQLPVHLLPAFIDIILKGSKLKCQNSW